MLTWRRLVIASVLAAPLLLLRGAHVVPVDAGSTDRLVVHEWGTFTSIAGADGVALEWRPLADSGKSDLPSFVHTITDVREGLRNPPRGKGQQEGTVRMETPVLYFYSARERTVSVKVDFPQGQVTEWYPQARSVGGGIDWGQLTIAPADGGGVQLPQEQAASHYYPARETDAALVKVCGKAGTQFEKFLFYRGVGQFDLPLTAALDGDDVRLRATAAAGGKASGRIGTVIVFERQGKTLGWRTGELGDKELTVARPKLDRTVDGDLDTLLAELQAQLVAQGLYEKEASAMIATWRDQWFEDGLRVFYLLPRAATDAVLPLTIDPVPTEVVRVLVGRTELVTPVVDAAVRSELRRLGDDAKNDDAVAAALEQRFGRFARALVARVAAASTDTKERARLTRFLAR